MIPCPIGEGCGVLPEANRAVVDAGVDSVKFSVNAPERKLYEFIHGKDDFDKVYDHLVYLNQYRGESGRDFKIYLTGILTRYTEHTKDDYFKVFDGLADQIVFKNVYNQGGYMPEIDWQLKCTDDKEQFRRCNLPFDALCVTCEGYLSVENADFENMLIVADLNKVSLREGWYGDKMKEVRRMFLDDCLEGTLCHGCVHHCQSPAEPLMPEYATENPDIFLDRQVRERIKAAGLPYTKLVYVPMAADILHPGHINILKTAASLGRVVVGLFSDEAIRSYKPEPYMDYERRKAVLESVKYVDEVVCQETKDYADNLRRYRPDYMVHGTDWRTGPLAQVREKGDYLRSQIEAMDLPCLGKTRGLGLMVGVEVKGGRTNKERAARLIDHGLLILTAGPGLRLLPPLTITREEMDRGLTIMKETLS